MKNKVQRKIVFATLVMVTGLCSATLGFSQGPEKLTGAWTNAKNTRRADFYSDGNRYFGKLVWGLDDTKVKPGDIIFKDLVWDGKKFNGTASTPARGGVSCSISFDRNNIIKITVFKGAVSKSVYWRRMK